MNSDQEQPNESDKAAARALRRRLVEADGVDLETPYFEVVEAGYLYQGCDHVQHGVRLDVPNRRVMCRRCGADVDAFDALINHARAERRLQNEAAAVRQHRAREVRREKLSQHVKKVALATQSEQDTLWTLTLECGHVVRSHRKCRTVSCYVCAGVDSAEF